MPISRMQQPRQMYGLGSFVKKAVKGVTNAVKSVAKSDLGKAALLYAGTAGLGSIGAGGGLGSLLRGSTYLPSNVMANLGTSLFGAPSIAGDITSIGGSKGLLGTLGITPGFGTKGFAGTAGMIKGGIGAATLLGGMFTAKEQEDIEELRSSGDPEKLKNYLRRYYTNLNPDADTETVESFVRANAAYGGRMGFADGKGKFLSYEEAKAMNPGDFVDTTTSAYGDAGEGRPVPRFLADKLQTLKESAGGISPRSRIDLLKQYLDQALQTGEISEEKYREMLMPFFGEKGEKVTEEIEEYNRKFRAYGGRMGFEGGGYTFEQFLKDKQQVDQAMSMEELRREYERMMKLKNIRDTRDIAAYGGRMGYALGDRAENNAIQASGIEGLPLNQNPAGITELDLRDNGGFIPPVGVKEKADDIPAMLSNNEFVFTADAVRGMGEGDVNVGAQRMYDMMKKLENGGRV